MPGKGKGKSIEEALDSLDNQVVDLVGEFVRRRRKHYEEAAQRLHAELKKDAKRYANMLADGKIEKEDFELLMKGRWAEIKIELLAELSISKAKFEDIALAVLKIVITTAFAMI